MTKPDATEQVSEELSIEELKSVSGGISLPDDSSGVKSPQGSGSGKTLRDWKKGNNTGVVILVSSDL